MKPAVEIFEQLQDALKAEAMAAAREGFNQDIVAAMADIDWSEGDDKCVEQLDKAIAKVAAKVGGYRKIAYATLYVLARLNEKGFITVTATNWKLKNGDNHQGSMPMKVTWECTVGNSISLHNSTNGHKFDISIDMEAVK